MSRQLIDREMASNRGFTSYDATQTIIRIMAASSHRREVKTHGSGACRIPYS
jgi:hypothetical protein